MNSVVLIGRLGRDVDLRFTQSGKAVATFSVAVNRMFSKEKEVDFFNVVVWGKPAENCANYLSKGRLVGIQGRLQSRSYEQNGEKRYVTEVVAEQVEFLEYGKSEGKNSNGGNGSSGDNPEYDLKDFEEVDGDDIPF